MDVVIDGVRYVPVCDAHPLAKQIAVGLAASFFGVLDPSDAETLDRLRGLTIEVREDGRGETIDDVVAEILEAIQKYPALSSSA